MSDAQTSPAAAVGNVARPMADYISQLVVWIFVSAAFPCLAFVAFIMVGRTAESQVGSGQLLLVSAALMATSIGSLIVIPGMRSPMWKILLGCSVFHLGLVLLYFGAATDQIDQNSISDKARPPEHVVSYSIYLYVSGIIIGAGCAYFAAKALDAEKDRCVAEEMQKRAVGR